MCGEKECEKIKGFTPRKTASGWMTASQRDWGMAAWGKRDKGVNEGGESKEF